MVKLFQIWVSFQMKGMMLTFLGMMLMFAFWSSGSRCRDGGFLQSYGPSTHRDVMFLFRFHETGAYNAAVYIISLLPLIYSVSSKLSALKPPTTWNHRSSQKQWDVSPVPAILE